MSSLRIDAISKAEKSEKGADGNTLTVIIGREVGYGVWTYFTFADEPEFELYYTTETRATMKTLAFIFVRSRRIRLNTPSDELTILKIISAGKFIGKRCELHAAGKRQHWQNKNFRTVSQAIL